MVGWEAVSYALVMNPGLPEEQQFILRQGTSTIGRTKDNAIYCLHKSLSRRHAQIELDGEAIRITDLHSKNGLFYNGERVTCCELLAGDSFRCGDVTFRVAGVASGATKASWEDRAAQTMPSPFVVDPRVSRRSSDPRGAPAAEDERRCKDKLFLLIRASELCVSEMKLDRLLEELVVLAVQVLEVDRITLLARGGVTLEMQPRVIKSFVPKGHPPYSQRVVDWIVDHGSPAAFADVSRDRTLPGDLARDALVRGAMCVPINPGGGTIGVIYADSLTRPDCFRPDDLALLRAIANLAAIAMESAALRSRARPSVVTR